VRRQWWCRWPGGGGAGDGGPQGRVFFIKKDKKSSHGVALGEEQHSRRK
jgi:hypothetical protein